MNKVPTVRDVKIFVPTKDFELSRRYYEALGWQCNWLVEGLAELEMAGHRIYLQRFYVKEWAENFMVYLDVESAEAWYQHVNGIIKTGEFPGARVEPPKSENYGALVTYAWDPSGVLLHFAQPCDN